MNAKSLAGATRSTEVLLSTEGFMVSVMMRVNFSTLAGVQRIPRSEKETCAGRFWPAGSHEKMPYCDWEQSRRGAW